MEVLLEIQKAIAGNKEAFNNVITMYERKLYFIAKLRIGNDEDVKDVMQETILNAYLNIKVLKEPEKFNAWITTILINNCNKHYKKNRLKVISYDELEENNVFMQLNNIEDGIHSDLSFFSIIDFLDMEEKMIISMYYLNEYTTKEISEILNLNESTLRSRISNIRNKIKMNIEKGDRK